MTTPAIGRIPNTNFRYVDEQTVHRGAVVDFHVVTVEGPDGARFDRDVVRHPGAVAVVAVQDDVVYLVQQYRVAFDSDLVEIPAGKRDVVGEPPERTAHRELVEEVGMHAGSMVPLLSLLPAAGFCDEELELFLATDLTPVAERRQGPEEVAMTIVPIPLVEAVERCLDGRIQDAKSVAGILAAASRLGGGTKDGA